MSKLIKNGNIINDEWKTLNLAEDNTPDSVKLPVGPVLVPLSVWKARRTELMHREYEHGWPLGVWLSAEESAEAIAQDIDDFTVIALKFDKYSDGQSYSTARVLREHYGYKGELRAIGDVSGDNLTYQHQVGFDAFAVQPNQKTENVLSGIFSFTGSRRQRQQYSALVS